jgi:hypothetical protein
LTVVLGDAHSLTSKVRQLYCECKRIPADAVIVHRRLADESAVSTGIEGVAENGGLVAGGWGDYAGAVAGKIGAVLFAGCVAGVEGEGKDVETECYAKSLTVEWSGGVMGGVAQRKLRGL